jgi:predicted 2-oxoglutarate/Fe(II)-dependent dioxygenase YbiX
MHLQDNILIQRDALGSKDLEFLMDHVRQARMTDSLVSSSEEDAASQWVVDRKIRDTQGVHLPRPILVKLNSIHDDCVRRFIDPFYAITVRDSEPLQLLHYGVGGHYIPHVDAETLYKDDMGLDLWEKTLDRDLSVVYFVNHGFTGGQLFFPALDLMIEPAAGTLVCFPADHHYIHGVKPVTAGRRYTLVTWLRVQGMPSVDEVNQLAMEEYERRWPQQIEQPPRLVKGGSSK